MLLSFRKTNFQRTGWKLQGYFDLKKKEKKKSAGRDNKIVQIVGVWWRSQKAQGRNKSYSGICAEDTTILKKIERNWEKCQASEVEERTAMQDNYNHGSVEDLFSNCWFRCHWSANGDMKTCWENKNIENVNLFFIHSLFSLQTFSDFELYFINTNISCILYYIF